MTLYDLTADYMQLQMMLEDPEEDPEAIQAMMDDLDEAIEDKADGYAKVIKNMESSLDAIKKEQERLSTRKSTLESGIKRLKENLQTAMIATDKRKFKTDLFSFAIQKNGGKVPVILDVEVDQLPDDLVKVERKPDLGAIAAYIEDTGDVTYAHLGERGESLRIR